MKQMKMSWGMCQKKTRYSDRALNLVEFGCSLSLTFSNIEQTWFPVVIVTLTSLKVISTLAHNEVPSIRVTIVLPHLIQKRFINSERGKQEMPLIWVDLRKWHFRSWLCDGYHWHHHCQKAASLGPWYEPGQPFLPEFVDRVGLPGERFVTTWTPGGSKSAMYPEIIGRAWCADWFIYVLFSRML